MGVDLGMRGGGRKLGGTEGGKLWLDVFCERRLCFQLRNISTGCDFLLKKFKVCFY